MASYAPAQTQFHNTSEKYHTVQVYGNQGPATQAPKDEYRDTTLRKPAHRIKSLDSNLLSSVIVPIRAKVRVEDKRSSTGNFTSLLDNVNIRKTVNPAPRPKTVQSTGLFDLLFRKPEPRIITQKKTPPKIGTTYNVQPFRSSDNPLNNFRIGARNTIDILKAALPTAGTQTQKNLLEQIITKSEAKYEEQEGKLAGEEKTLAEEAKAWAQSHGDDLAKVQKLVKDGSRDEAGLLLELIQKKRGAREAQIAQTTLKLTDLATQYAADLEAFQTDQLKSIKADIISGLGPNNAQLKDKIESMPVLALIQASGLVSLASQLGNDLSSAQRELGETITSLSGTVSRRDVELGTLKANFEQREKELLEKIDKGEKTISDLDNRLKEKIATVPEREELLKLGNDNATLTARVKELEDKAKKTDELRKADQRNIDDYKNKLGKAENNLKKYTAIFDKFGDAKDVFSALEGVKSQLDALREHTDTTPKEVEAVDKVAAVFDKITNHLQAEKTAFDALTAAVQKLKDGAKPEVNDHLIAGSINASKYSDIIKLLVQINQQQVTNADVAKNQKAAGTLTTALRGQIKQLEEEKAQREKTITDLQRDIEASTTNVAAIKTKAAADVEKLKQELAAVTASKSTQLDDLTAKNNQLKNALTAKTAELTQAQIFVRNLNAQLGVERTKSVEALKEEQKKIETYKTKVKELNDANDRLEESFLKEKDKVSREDVKEMLSRIGLQEGQDYVPEYSSTGTLEDLVFYDKGGRSRFGESTLKDVLDQKLLDRAADNYKHWKNAGNKNQHGLGLYKHNDFAKMFAESLRGYTERVMAPDGYKLGLGKTATYLNQMKKIYREKCIDFLDIFCIIYVEDLYKLVKDDPDDRGIERFYEGKLMKALEKGLERIYVDTYANEAGDPKFIVANALQESIKVNDGGKTVKEYLRNFVDEGKYKNLERRNGDHLTDVKHLQAVLDQFRT